MSYDVAGCCDSVGLAGIAESRHLSGLGYLDIGTILGISSAVMTAGDFVGGELPELFPGGFDITSIIQDPTGSIQGLIEEWISGGGSGVPEYRLARAEQGLQALTDTLTKFVAYVRSKGIDPNSQQFLDLYRRFVWDPSILTSPPWGTTTDGSRQCSPEPIPCTGSPCIKSGHYAHGDWMNTCHEVLRTLGYQGETGVDLGGAGLPDSPFGVAKGGVSSAMLLGAAGVGLALLLLR